jgi:hypothetical protein
MLFTKELVVFILVVAFCVLNVNSRSRKGPALDIWYKNRAKEFHEAWAKEDGVITLESGLQYKIIQKSATASSNHPAAGDVVALRFQVFVPDEDAPYRHMIGNNVYVDESTKELKGMTTNFKMANLLEGWRRGVELMTEGDHWELYLPYQMAYGSLGRPDTRPAVPVFSPLIVNVWLDKINPPEPVPDEGKEESMGTPAASSTKPSQKNVDTEEEEHVEL